MTYAFLRGKKKAEKELMSQVESTPPEERLGFLLERFNYTKGWEKSEHSGLKKLNYFFVPSNKFTLVKASKKYLSDNDYGEFLRMTVVKNP